MKAGFRVILIQSIRLRQSYRTERRRDGYAYGVGRDPFVTETFT